MILCGAANLRGADAVIVGSPAVNVHDMFSGLLAHRTPAIPELKVVRPNEKFNIYILLSKLQTRKGNAHVTGSLYLKNNDSKVFVFKDQELFYGKCPAPGAVNLSNLVANWDFNDSFDQGRYTFVIDIKDVVNGKTSSASFDIELVKTPLEPLKITTKEIRGFISSFYKAPQPARMLELFNIFLAGDAEARKQKNYSPLPLLYGMARVLEHHPYLWKDFADCSFKLEGDHKKYLALLFAAVNEKAVDYMIKKADRKTAGYLKKMKENNPWQFEEPYLRDDINAFWMEFFFTGKPQPILKIANQLKNRPSLTAKQAKERKGELSAADRVKLRNYYSASSASWSIGINAAQHNLVFFYLEEMLEHGKFADAAAAAKIQKLLFRSAANTSENK